MNHAALTIAQRAATTDVRPSQTGPLRHTHIPAARNFCHAAMLGVPLVCELLENEVGKYNEFRREKPSGMSYFLFCEGGA